jgi:RHS repeat-associated protein
MTYADIDQTQRLTAGSTSFVHTPLGVTRQTVGGVSQHYIRDPYGNLIAVRTGSSSYYYVLDRLGSIVAVTDNTGAVAARYTYDPYGQATATGSFSQPWQYASGYRDANTGQIKFGTRYYQPNLGRWTQPDPSGFPNGPNNYLYVGSNPTNITDPSGLFWSEVWDDAVDWVGDNWSGLLAGIATNWLTRAVCLPLALAAGAPTAGLGSVVVGVSCTALGFGASFTVSRLVNG